MTQQGRRHLRRLDKVIATLQDELLEPLPESEREQFVRTLTKLLDHHAGKSGATSW
jgi:DNA-binding MarR family transcriptional regulator